MIYPFEIDVLVFTRPWMRDPAIEYERYMGKLTLDKMYDTFEIDPSIKSLYLSYPEQWLNIIEQRQLYDRCKHYLPNLKKLEIKTHSVYILQITSNKNIRVVTYPDGYIDETAPVTESMCNRNQELNLFNLNCLNACTPDGVKQIKGMGIL